MGQFLYELNSKEKVTCPSCGEDGRFVRYFNTSTKRFLEGDYGRCDRENDCGYHKKPERNRPLKLNMNEEVEAQNLYDSDFIPEHWYNDFHKNPKNIPNVLLRGLTERFGKKKVYEVYKKYNLGTFYGGATVFPYRTFFLHTAKIIWYDENLKRKKTGDGNYPQWIHNARYGEYICEFDGRRTVPFFGTHLILDINFDKANTYIGLVESEKTAIIMSIFFPKIIWLASGGLSHLNKMRFFPFHLCKILVFPDMGIVKNENLSTRDVWETKLREGQTVSDFLFKFVPYIPYFMPTIKREEWEDDGMDVVDFILEYPSEWLKDGYTSYVDYLKQMIDETIKNL